LEKGANVNAGDKYDGSTALMDAAGSGHQEVVRVLLDNGANVNAKREYGATALKIARAKGHKEIAELLKSHGAKE